MLTEGISSIGDGLLEVAEERLKGLLVPEDINEIYDVEQTPFARGKFAAVRRAIHKRSGVHFAAKFLRRRRRAQSSDKEIKHEIAVLILCSGCENIVKLNAVHETRSDTALLLELATGGELQAILDNDGSLTEAQTRVCMIQVLKALQFLHKRSIAHLDLKPQNILLTGKKVEDGLKLCDFGISRVIENGSKVREILGTPDYVAPEVLQYEPLSLQTDIWSVGVLTYVLLSGCSPFGGDTKQETFLNISQCSLTFPDELFKGVSHYAIDFIKSTLRIKPYDRLTAFECLEHIWLKAECPIADTLFAVSSASEDLTEGNEETTHDKDMDENGDKNDSDKKFKNQQCTSENDSDSSRNHRNHSWSGHDSSENNKENFMTYTSNRSITSNGFNNGVVVSNVIAQSKSSSSTIKYNSSMLINRDSCTVVKYQSCGLSNSDIIHSNTEKSKEISQLKSINISTTSSSSSNSSSSSSSLGVTSTTTATATICLFPDAPTTPKVIRKAPSCTSKSVKALVKKFQLEVDETQGNCIETGNTDSGDSIATSNKSNNRNSNDRGGGNAFKNSCAFCLKCGGPGCRHSGSTTVNKSSSAISMDHGIIC